MGIYEGRVVEIRRYERSYWVEADGPAEANEKMESGETICEIGPSKYEGVSERVVVHGPVKAKHTPIEQLLKRAEERKLNPSDLDSTVHEIMSRQASGINNRGLEDQLYFLLSSMSLEDALSTIDAKSV